MKNIGLLLLIILLSASISIAQCKRLAKKNVEGLGPFEYNGQVTSTIMTEGETASIMMSFQSGVQYRILACGDRFFEDIKMEVFDENENLIYSNEGHEFADHWDFELDEAINLVVKITLPISEIGNNDIAYRGCVALLVGMRGINNF